MCDVLLQGHFSGEADRCEAPAAHLGLQSQRSRAVRTAFLFHEFLLPHFIRVFRDVSMAAVKRSALYGSDAVAAELKWYVVIMLEKSILFALHTGSQNGAS